MPWSREAEQSAVGGLLLDNGAWDRAGGIVAERDFYNVQHRLIFGAVGRLITAGRPADVITVFETLRSLGKAHDCGGLSYLNALAQSVPSAANMRRYAEIVREHSARWGLIATAGEALTLAGEQGDLGRASTRSTNQARDSSRFFGIEGARYWEQAGFRPSSLKALA